MRRDGLLERCAITAGAIRIEERVDDRIRVEVRFAQRFRHGAPPEFARLDDFEVNQARDAIAQQRNQ